MRVEFNHGRALILPFTEEKDKPEVNPKESLHIHNKVFGFFLHLAGKAERMKDENGKVFYATKKIPKAGIKTHNVVAGFLLSWVGKAEKFHDGLRDKDFYVDTQSAIKWLKRHGINNPTPIEPYGDNVGLLFRSPWKKVGEAVKKALEIEDLTKIIRDNPADPRTHYFILQRGYLFANHGNFEKANEDFNHAFEISKNDQEKSEALQYRAECFTKEGTQNSLEKAVEDYTTLHAMDPKGIYMRYYGTTPLEQRAAVYEKMGKTDLAIKDLTEIVENPNLQGNSGIKGVLLNRGDLYYKRGGGNTYSLAIADYQKAGFHWGAAKLYAEMEDYPAAQAELRKIKDPSPADKDFLKRIDKLVKNEQKKTPEDYKKIGNHRMAAELYEESRNYSAALEELKKIKKLSRSDKAFLERIEHLVKAESYVDKKDYSTALEELRKIKKPSYADKAFMERIEKLVKTA